MGVVIGAIQAASQIGIDGAMYWSQVNDTITAAMIRTLAMPGNVGLLEELSCASLYRGDAYLVGGFSHNLRMTKRLGLVIQGILPPTNEIVNAAGSGTKVGFEASGTGLTADVIPYISFYDELTDERSPLSAAGPTLSLTNDGLSWTNLPTSVPEEDYKLAGSTTANAATAITGVSTLFTKFVRLGDEIALDSAPSTFSRVTVITSNTALTVATALGDGTTQRIIVRRRPRWTHVELWRSVDGSLPRLVARIPRGVTSFTEAVAVGDLGESFTEDFERFSRCKYGVMWRDRQVMAGYEEDSARLFLSLIGLPERQSSLELRTLNGEPIVGLVVVHHTLIVLCPTSSYVVRGYTDEDISMEIFQPALGCVSHHAIKVIHGNAWIPTHLGPFICNGASWYPANRAIKRNWVDDYAERPSAYENSWAVHDPVRQVYKIYLGLHGTTNPYDVSGRFTYLVADYTTVIPQEGGELGQPRWSFDVREREDHFAFTMASPGGRRQDVYAGSCDGTLYKENWSHATADSTATRTTRIVHGADHYQDHGGDFVHGKTFQDFELFLQNEGVIATLKLYAGDEYAYPGDNPVVNGNITAGEQTIVDGGGDTVYYEPRQVVPVKPLEGVTGRALTVSLQVADAGDFAYRGYQTSWLPGPAPRRFVRTVAGGG